jgi:CheY-like chemotaxis protein
MSKRNISNHVVMASVVLALIIVLSMVPTDLALIVFALMGVTLAGLLGQFSLKEASVANVLGEEKIETFPEGVKSYAITSLSTEQSSKDDLNILLVEDNKTIQLVIGNTLRQMNASVSSAFDGFDAMSAVQNERFDLILMDLTMPKISGDIAAYKIKMVDGLNIDTPIVALTENCQEDDLVLASQVFDAFIRKPLAKPALRKVLIDLQGNQLLLQRYL